MSALLAANPSLLVSDIVKSAAYYTDKLGFAVDSFWGDPPMFAIARRDGVSVGLNQVGAGDAFRPNATYDGRYDVYFDVADADALFAEFTGKGADVVCAPNDQPYMMREFSVRDVDGHLLAFGHAIPGASNG
jgi:catechol 2,3-dioxygenase-like lactoylglutathione lyase family enzyme